MEHSVLVRPNLEFIREMKAYGGDTLKRCFQCATCSVVCNLSPDERPFPRKEMIWAQWGLKDKLTYDPDVWLCHQCGDCSTYCPRGAKPADVFAALRRRAILENASPRALAKALDSPKGLPIAFGIPVVLVLIFGLLAGGFRTPSHVHYADFMPHIAIDVLYSLTAIWAVICAALGIKKVWMGMNAQYPVNKEYRYSPLEFITLFIIPAIYDALRHNNFIQCVTNRLRFFSHFGILWGFVLLFITTSSVAVGVYIFGVEPPWPLSHPIKWIGNLGALFLLAGVAIALIHRWTKREQAGTSTYFDWVFLWVVVATGLSGVLTELFRLGDVAALAYPIYFVHLVCVWFLFAYLPFTKFAHMFYRTTAFVYARYSGRRLRKGKATTILSMPQEPHGAEGASPSEAGHESEEAA